MVSKNNFYLFSRQKLVNIPRPMVPNRFWVMSHFGISKILMTPENI